MHASGFSMILDHLRASDGIVTTMQYMPLSPLIALDCKWNCLRRNTPSEVPSLILSYRLSLIGDDMWHVMERYRGREGIRSIPYLIGNP